MATKLNDLSAQREIQCINERIDRATFIEYEIMKRRRSYLITKIYLGLA